MSGFVGAALVYAKYIHAISLFQGGVAATKRRPSLPFLLRLQYVFFSSRNYDPVSDDHLASANVQLPYKTQISSFF